MTLDTTRRGAAAATSQVRPGKMSSAAASSAPAHQQSSGEKKQQQHPPPLASPSAALPSPLETWEQQRSRASAASAAPAEGPAARRILPLPGQRKLQQDSYESETARHVRLLLARHGHPQQPRPPGMANVVDLVDQSQSGSDGSDQFSSALPGDSYPDTERQLLSMQDEDDEGGAETSSEEELLLRRLTQSQARMEQIKRMLVNQRGFIVQALKQMAEASSKPSPSSAAAAANGCHACRQQQQQRSFERDRTLGSSVRHAAEMLPPVQPNPAPDGGGSGRPTDADWCRLCPMCEAAFPGDVDQDEFEQHVVEHFCFEEPDTLKYVASAEES